MKRKKIKVLLGERLTALKIYKELIFKCKEVIVKW